MLASMTMLFDNYMMILFLLIKPQIIFSKKIHNIQIRLK